MKCPSCDRDINSRSIKCVYCGVNVEVSDLNKKNKKKNNRIIVLIEIVSIFTITIIYSSLYGEKIRENFEYSHKSKIIKLCEQHYEGKWNDTKKICETAVGNIEIK